MHNIAFPDECRRWRHIRKLSQLELSLRANVSQRHVSWLERGKSQPSRDMVVRLSEAMDIPLRARNALLRAAGFAPLYRESALDSEQMAPVYQAIRRILEHHDPLPALLVDRMWHVLRQNDAASRLFSLVSDTRIPAAAGEHDSPLNLAILTLHPDGLRQYITNWHQAAPAFLRRLREEANASGDSARLAQFEQLNEVAGVDIDAESVDPLLPVVPLELSIRGVELSLFSVISTLGTPQDVTTDELRIETFYPNDEPTRRFFEQN